MTHVMDAIAPARTAAGRPALEGSLTDLAPTELLRLLGQTRQTGTLQVLADGPSLLTLVDGAVSYATDDPSRTLRDVLIAEGLVDEPTWDAAAARDPEELGTALVDAGVSEAEIARVLRRIVLETATDLSLAPDGRFRFVPGRRHSLGERMHYPCTDLVRDLGVRLDEWELIRSDVPSFTHRGSLAPTLPSDRTNVAISAADWRVLVVVSASPTLDDARRDLDLTRFVLARSVGSLVRAGALVLTPTA
jgi:hypothetical protein